jgi:hypothetical protein
MGDIPHQLEFLGICFSGFANSLTISVILWKLEAELSILRCLIKLIRGVISKNLNPQEKVSAFVVVSDSIALAPCLFAHAPRLFFLQYFQLKRVLFLKNT